MAGRRLLRSLLAVVACIALVVSVLFLKSGRKTPIPAEGPAYKTAPITVETAGPKDYLTDLESIRVRLSETARRNAAGEFEELSPEQRPDMSDAELAKIREVVQVAAKREVLAMGQVFRTPEEYAKAASEFESKRATTVAFGHYLKAAELKPDFAEAHAGLGRTLQLMGHTKEAIAAFEAAVRLAPSRPGWLAELGLSLYTDGRFDAALEVYDKALELKPDFARVYYNKAVVYWRKGDYDQAWLNVEKCREYGEEPPQTFVQKLSRDSGREPPEHSAADVGNRSR